MSTCGEQAGMQARGCLELAGAHRLRARRVAEGRRGDEPPPLH